MSVEIRPAEAIASLERINQDLKNISSSIVSPIKAAIDNFNSDNELQGKAFDNLKTHMSNEIDSGLLNQLTIAANALEAANMQHISALGLISQYSIINQDQLRDDIGRVHANLAFANSNIFSGGGEWVALLNAELAYLNQKQIDYGAYLAASSGLYNNLFAGLDGEVSRMNFAIFCKVSGFVSVPTTTAMVYLVELTKLDDYGRPILDEDGNLIFINWDRIDEILNKDINDVSDAQWIAISTVLTLMNYSELTDFYNRILVQNNIMMFISGYQQEVETWQLDMAIMERLMWGMGVLSDEMRARQLALPYLGNIGHLSVEEQNRLRQRYGSLIDDLAFRNRRVVQQIGILAFLYSMQLQEGMIITMDPSISAPSLSFSTIYGSNDERVGFTFSFVGGSYPGSRLLTGPISGGGGIFDGQEFNISIPLMLGQKNPYLADIFFNSSGNIISDGVNATVSYIISATIAYASKGLSFFLSVFGAIAAGEQERRNHQILVDSGMATSFEMYSIYITNQHGNAIQDILLPSYRTQGRIDYLNSRLGDAGHLGTVVANREGDNGEPHYNGYFIVVPEGGLTIEDFYNRPEEVRILYDRYRHQNN